MQTFVARAGQHMGGYLEEELRALFDEGHFLPSDHYWRDGMAEWGTLGELFGVPENPAPIAPAPIVAEKARSPLRWIVPSVVAVVLVVVGVYITVTYFSRKMAEAAAPVMQPSPMLESSIPHLADSSKPANLLQLPASENTQVKDDESAAVSKDIQRLSNDCREAEKDMLLLGFDPTRMTSPEAIEQRRQSIEIVIPRLQALVDYLNNIDQKIRTDLQAKNVPSTEVDLFISELHQDGRRDALLKYWQQENAISNDMMSNLIMLQKNYGKWHLDGGTVVFNDPGMLLAYRANVDKLKADIAAQQAAQAALKNTDDSTSNP